MNYAALMQKARKTNAQRDEADRNLGFATPFDLGVSECVKTAMEAIRAGIENEDWDFVAEAQVILEDAAKIISQKGAKS